MTDQQLETQDIDPETLFCDSVELSSRFMDWGNGDDNQKWGYVQVDQDDESEEGPMMNYFWPLPEYESSFDVLYGQEEFKEKKARHAKALKDTVALCLVWLGEEGEESEWGLALTGGGMDLSWDIAEAYMLCGYLPPAKIDLPLFSGKELTPRNQAIIAACRRSQNVVKEWVESRLQDLLKLEKRMSEKGKRS
jgi:hypothetical protein